MVKWWHWVRSASNDPLLKAIFFFFPCQMYLTKIMKEFSVLWVAADVVWPGSWWVSLLPGWPLAVHQIWTLFLDRSALRSLLMLPMQRPISPCHVEFSEEETSALQTGPDLQSHVMSVTKELSKSNDLVASVQLR